MKQNTSYNATQCMESFWPMLQSFSAVQQWPRNDRTTHEEPKTQPKLIGSDDHDPDFEPTLTSCMNLWAFFVEISGFSWLSFSWPKDPELGRLIPLFWSVHTNWDRPAPWASALLWVVPWDQNTKHYARLWPMAMCFLSHWHQQMFTLTLKIHCDGSGLKLQEWRCS